MATCKTVTDFACLSAETADPISEMLKLDVLEAKMQSFLYAVR